MNELFLHCVIDYAGMKQRKNKGYKIIFAIALCLVMIVSSLQNFMLYSSFKLNQDFISKVLCINVDKPEMNCNGQCHLMKTLEKAKGQPENSQSSNQISNERIQLFITDDFPVIQSHCIYLVTTSSYASFELLEGVAPNIFPPPIISVS